jgi:hypothetical protein
MRVSRTLLAFVALLLFTACNPTSPDPVAAGGTSGSKSVAGDGGIGQIGSGNATTNAAGQDGPGQIGSGNGVSPDSTFTPSSTPQGGIGQIGSGN